jgi:NADH-quinone oxidoreductase subunit B
LRGQFGIGLASLRCVWEVASRPGVGVQVVGAGLACCSLEVEAAVQRGLLVPAEGLESGEGDLIVLVIAGTITRALEPAVRRMHEELSARGPVRVLAFGACATSGGPYWDAPAVVCGVEELFTGEQISSYVPGCPPRPEALITELERIADESAVTT